jgi:hypothetical protein
MALKLNRAMLNQSSDQLLATEVADSEYPPLLPFSVIPKGNGKLLRRVVKDLRREGYSPLVYRNAVYLPQNQWRQVGRDLRAGLEQEKKAIG